jgi:hypothetical protein
MDNQFFEASHQRIADRRRDETVKEPTALPAVDPNDPIKSDINYRIGNINYQKVEMGNSFPAERPINQNSVRLFYDSDYSSHI